MLHLGVWYCTWVMDRKARSPRLPILPVRGACLGIAAYGWVRLPRNPTLSTQSACPMLHLDGSGFQDTQLYLLKVPVWYCIHLGDGS